MIDILMKIYEVIKSDDKLSELLDQKEEIFFNRYPEVESIEGPCIIIDDIITPMPKEYADNNYMTHNYIVQIDVYTKVNVGINARLLRDEITERIIEVLKQELSVDHISSGQPEYDDEYQIYRSSNRFEGTFYKKELNL
ncbi:hypothetical protein [Abyssicoccus albus]|uniref:hypothetical protein n=1 Tax=Abyssicoccus albus TaxID=1817405 RepID=UPI00097E2503|nr:hypothetical protein [Abyssicoccus albus]AQL56417.1 hypothetical protein BVH56_05525 [Abyssicoccus albus]